MFLPCAPQSTLRLDSDSTPQVQLEKGRRPGDRGDSGLHLPILLFKPSQGWEHKSQARTPGMGKCQVIGPPDSV